MNTDITSLEARLRKLEKQNRLLITSLVLGVGLLIFTAATPSQPADPKATVAEVRAMRIVLVDSKNQEVGVWEADRSGLPSFVMGTTAGHPAIRLEQTSDGASFRLTPPNAEFSSWDVTNVTSVLLLRGKDPVTAKTGSLVLNGTSNPTAYLLNANGAKIEIKPGSPYPLASFRGDNTYDWFITSEALSLNGIKLKLNDYNGKPIKELP